MKFLSIPSVAAALAIATAAAITGCGNNSSGIAGYPGGLAPGMPGYPGYGGGGCVPVSQPIPFTGTNIQMDPYTQTFNAGMLPMTSQPYGSMVIGGNPQVGGPVQGSGVDGMITMTISNTMTAPQQYPGGYPSYPYGGTMPMGGPMNLTGSLSISPIQQQQIMTTFGYGMYGTNPYSPYPSYPTTGTYPGTMPQPGLPNNGQVCVSGIAIGQGHIYSSGIPNFGGQIYLYINNTQHGYTLNFY